MLNKLKKTCRMSFEVGIEMKEVNEVIKQR